MRGHQAASHGRRSATTTQCSTALECAKAANVFEVFLEEPSHSRSTGAEWDKKATRVMCQGGVAEDVDMGEDTGVRLLNAPAISQPPMFKGSTKAERRGFMRKYQRYTSQIEALQSTVQRPFLMPVRACMDPFSKRRIAMFDLGKSHGDVTETEWVAWFMEAQNEEPVELDALKSRAIRHEDPRRRQSSESNAGQPDARSRGRRPKLGAASRKKLVVGIITKAIKPASLQVAVTKQLQLQRNKVLKADVFRFIKWLRQFAAGYQLYGGVDEEKPAKAPVEARPRSEQRQSSRGYSRIHGSNDNKPNVAPTVHGALKTDKGSWHRVREHPGITDDEVKKLLDEFYASRRGVNAMKNSDKGKSMECRATLDDVLVLPRVLLDSGLDESLKSNRLLQAALERLGSRLSVVDKPTVMLKPYGEHSLPLKVTRQVQFKALTLETSIGPLALRGLKAWMDEQSPQIKLLIGRPVMERLGFRLMACSWVAEEASNLGSRRFGRR
ncbi:hypothetical protein H310_11566 [Aphanomyces invadans]|uniref:Peptidase A2 domain-containing protein n=1 Tax=Aphanomyces invadans TaxID=157072 RepID=A0A024TLB7_9STRA|nr:hypothetical protein H310_11566 [Aphanomyces invadans]ETV94920.1 hypothetical protein H310_11566 [Aphanomyces invadans]|eukprot:XP_008876511.1 hypothetical protein H310_11566 [Aphanomyces invadans]